MKQVITITLVLLLSASIASMAHAETDEVRARDLQRERAKLEKESDPVDRAKIGIKISEILLEDVGESVREGDFTEMEEHLAEYAATAPVNGAQSGIRIGVIARTEDADAWSVARARFPEDRKGQLTHQLAMKVSDSSWHRQLSELGNTGLEAENPYWLVPFQNYKAMCPYLVGSYDRVADEVARYVAIGYRTFILEAPASPDEMRHIGVVFERAVARCPAT